MGDGERGKAALTDRRYDTVYVGRGFSPPPVERGVTGAVDLTHAVRTEGGLDLVRAELLPSFKAGISVLPAPDGTFIPIRPPGLSVRLKTE